jgi:uncharacterized protein (DUF169 family)
MTNVHRRFSERFRSQWIKIKFYEDKQDFNGAEILKKVRFCEATKEAVVRPVVIDKDSISCVAARYVFGWTNDHKKVLDICNNKQEPRKNITEAMLKQCSRFKKPFKYIGLNTDGEPDLVMSYMDPYSVMNFIKVFNNKHVERVKCSLSGMTPICGGIAVETFLKKNINISFGCDDSRNFAEIRRENLAVAVPNELFKSFID